MGNGAPMGIGMPMGNGVPNQAPRRLFRVSNCVTLHQNLAPFRHPFSPLFPVSSNINHLADSHSLHTYELSDIARFSGFHNRALSVRLGRFSMTSQSNFRTRVLLAITRNTITRPA